MKINQNICSEISALKMDVGKFGLEFVSVLLQCCGFMMSLKGIPSTYNKDLQV